MMVVRFRSGDGACIHLVEVRGGGLFYAARFRCVLTHSFRRQRLLGRNLITVFSTVNTPREEISRRRVGAAGEQQANEMRWIRRRCRARVRLIERRAKESAQNKCFYENAVEHARDASRSRLRSWCFSVALAQPDREMKNRYAADGRSRAAQVRLRGNCANFRGRFPIAGHVRRHDGRFIDVADRA